jgi:hypothetical protein
MVKKKSKESMENLKLFFTGGTLGPANIRLIEASGYELVIGRFDLTEEESLY